MSQTAISEAASKKRGRPRVMDVDFQKTFHELWGQELSLKTIQERSYATKALNRLGGIDECKAKYPRLIPSTELFRWSLMAELDRMDEPEVMREFARQFNDSSLTIKEAVARIRAYRTGKRPEPDAMQLASLLAKTVDQYQATTDCDWALILEAVTKLQETCQRLADEL